MNCNTKYMVCLTGDEQEELESLVIGAGLQRRSDADPILLKADAGAEGYGLIDQEVGNALD